MLRSSRAGGIDKRRWQHPGFSSVHMKRIRFVLSSVANRFGGIDLYPDSLESTHSNA
jgi:hypothetical protein